MELPEKDWAEDTINQEITIYIEMLEDLGLSLYDINKFINLIEEKCLRQSYKILEEKLPEGCDTIADLVLFKHFFPVYNRITERQFEADNHRSLAEQAIKISSLEEQISFLQISKQEREVLERETLNNKFKTIK